MYGLNAMAIAAFFGINILAYNLCKCGKKRRKHIMNVLCILLLGGNLLRYGIVYPLILGEIRIPAEFSTVSYFVVPALLLTTRKKGRSWAAYSGLMAGFFYYLALMVMGGKIYGGEMPYCGTGCEYAFDGLSAEWGHRSAGSRKGTTQAFDAV